MSCDSRDELDQRRMIMDDSKSTSPEVRLQELSIQLPPPPTPFGAYVPAVQTGNLLSLSGMLPSVGHEPKFLGRLGKELNVEEGRRAAYTATLNTLAVARQHLGSLDKVIRVVRLGVSVATFGDFFDQTKVAEVASELFRNVFGVQKTSARRAGSHFRGKNLI